MKKLVVADEAFRQLKKALDSCNIPYLIGGSVASSVRGDPRFTNDVDVVARILPEQVDRFVDALGRDWSVDADAIREAILRDRSYNIFFLREFQKVDFFPASEPFHFTQIERATEVNFGDSEDPILLCVASAEDIVLAKLAWYKMSGGNLPRQLDDIAKVVAINPGMDREYMFGWAAKLGVGDLLTKVLREAANKPEGQVDK